MDIYEDLKKVAALPYRWDKLAGSRIAISGGTGFLGSALIGVFNIRNALYNDDIRVVSLSRSGKKRDDGAPNDYKSCAQYIAADVTHPVRIDGKVDYVIHLASNTHPAQYALDPVGTITGNVLGADNLLRLAAEKQAKRFLLASSVEIYGSCPPRPVDESYCGYIDCNTARAGYNEAKRLSESLARSYESQYGVDVAIVRLARCFGPDFTKKDTKVMAQFLRCAAAGQDIVLKSQGTQRYSYCYYADAVSGMIAVLTDGKSGEAYNVADDDEGFSLRDFAEYIALIAGCGVREEFSHQPGSSAAVNALLDCGKIKQLGFRPLFTLRQALKKTYEILVKHNDDREGR